ncbi:hypothetical protein BN946_scf184842.g15 [Trametes cinnabarina]|uniref:Uncharacterized protein n=1 Tax=Pycnoporus cinnabarinus TaxID=5643 RepID=A0A060S1L6_PYCCI|nr:hypothetical protein BN946_scf184842.g15 [Trametes cinnabarina]
MLPHRPLPREDTIELDYGQEEPSGTSSIASSPAAVPAKVVMPPVAASEPMQLDHSPSKEEGEISDSELAPPTPKAKLEPLSTGLVELDGIAASTKPALPMHESIPYISDVQPPPCPPTSDKPTTSTMLVDDNHVRPGLALTQAQYDTAKDIILDLLGWGVPPEYLVGCGLSREIVFYVFVELNLRLPSNLDTTGLPPIPTPSTSQGVLPTVASPHPTQSHPSVPHQPASQPESSSDSAVPMARPLSANAPSFVPAAADVSGPSSASLHDMEQQRRQELLARKAVLASRRLKKGPPPVASPSQTIDKPGFTHGVATIEVVPPKVVDDFLQSIEPASEDRPRPMTISPPSTYEMDVDDVPGLTTTLQGPITEYTPLPRPPPPASISTTVFNVTKPQSPVVPQSAASTTSDRSSENGPSTSSFSTTPLSYDRDDDMDVVPGLYHPNPDDSNASKPRRGTKRPVAADFVDMDSGPSRAGVKAPTELFRANIRRKTAGFAGITQRRCIIDLSDSEAEEEGNMKQTFIPPRTDSRGPKAGTPQASTAPTPRHHSPAVAPPVTPAILEEKEAEIRRMRELIARREQNRKKKLAAVSRSRLTFRICSLSVGKSSRSTPLNKSTPTTGFPIKQEDDDSASLRSFEPSGSVSSVTPEPVANGRPNDSQDERSVLAALLPHGMLGSNARFDSLLIGSLREWREWCGLVTCI